MMSDANSIEFELYDYAKLNASGMLRRISTDIHGQNLKGWELMVEETPQECWHWITS